MAGPEAELTQDTLPEGAYCTTVEGFFTQGARELAGRYLTNFLESLVITPTELMFSAKAQKRLNDAGRTLMNATDKIATLQAKAKGESAGQRLKDLNALISAGMKRMWDDDKDKPPSAITPDGFAAFVSGFKEEGAARDYAVNRALAEHLSQFKVWKDKVKALLGFHDKSKGTLAHPYIELILSECLRSDAGLDQLLGLAETLEERCLDLIALWKGEWAQRDKAHPGMPAIAAMIQDGTGTNLKASVEVMLLKVLAAKEPLRSAEPEVEIQVLFDMFKRLWIGNGLIGGSKAMASLERRQARHLSREGLTDLLRERKVVAERYAFLMQVAAIATGPANRATVKSFIDHYFADKDFVPRIIAGQEPPVPKMQTLTTIHRSLRQGWLSDSEKNAHCAQVEAAQLQLLKTSRLLEQVDKKSGTAAQKVLTLLDMCRKATFIDGQPLGMIKTAIQTYLRDPAFLPDYLAGASGEEKERKMALLTKTLASIGIGG